MTTNADIYCQHVDQDWLAGSDCWLCPGCLCAVCSRCRELYTSFPALGEERVPWWTHSCGCRSQFSTDVLLPPSCWTRDSVTASPEAVPAISKAHLARATPPEPGAVISRIRERLTAPDGARRANLATMHSVLDEVQKIALYWDALGRRPPFESFVSLVDSLTKDIRALDPGLIELDRKYAAQVRQVRDAQAAIDYRGGDPLMANKLSLRLLLDGMTENDILAQARQDPDFRERVAPLYPTIAAQATTPDATKGRWWRRLFGKSD